MNSDRVTKWILSLKNLDFYQLKGGAKIIRSNSVSTVPDTFIKCETHKEFGVCLLYQTYCGNQYKSTLTGWKMWEEPPKELIGLSVSNKNNGELPTVNYWCGKRETLVETTINGTTCEVIITDDDFDKSEVIINVSDCICGEDHILHTYDKR